MVKVEKCEEPSLQNSSSSKKYLQNRKKQSENGQTVGQDDKKWQQILIETRKNVWKNLYNQFLTHISNNREDIEEFLINQLEYTDTKKFFSKYKKSLIKTRNISNKYQFACFLAMPKNQMKYFQKLSKIEQKQLFYEQRQQQLKRSQKIQVITSFSNQLNNVKQEEQLYQQNSMRQSGYKQIGIKQQILNIVQQNQSDEDHYMAHFMDNQSKEEQQLQYLEEKQKKRNVSSEREIQQLKQLLEEKRALRILFKVFMKKHFLPFSLFKSRIKNVFCYVSLRHYIELEIFNTIKIYALNQ